jgi:non-specific serine/threonine protein kinase
MSATPARHGGTAGPGTFGELLQAYRRAVGWTQDELAERARLSPEAISALERGVRARPRRETVRLLATALQLDAPMRGHLEAAAGRAATPGPVSAAQDVPDQSPSPTHNLPPELSSFVGRGRDVAKLQNLLATARLVTLTGVGGCGKTRLALRVAECMLRAYPEGVWLVELAPVADPQRVPHAVAAVLGVREDKHRSLQTVLAGLIGSRRMLLVLDNCEHLIESCARLCVSLLRGGAQLTILATTREALGVDGEVVWQVPPLPLPPVDPAPSPAALADYDAVALFLARARAIEPTFALTTRNAPAVGEICRRLDGIPLAIELAAARTKVLPPEQIATMLDHRFRLLSGGSRAALPRQQTLAASVGWSYDLLSEAERTFFDRVSVFAGGFTLEAAHSVCAWGSADAWQVLDLLQKLVDKSLVLVESGENGVGRYRLLETLRQFGQDKLAAHGTTEAMRRRHAEYFLALGEQGARNWGSADRPVWLLRLAAEHDNSRLALRWMVGSEAGSAGDPQGGLRLVAALRGFWNARGYFAEGRAWAMTALERAPNAPPGLRGRAFYVAALLAYMPGNHADAEPLAREAVRLAREAGDVEALAWALFLLGYCVFLGRGDLAGGEELAGEALRLAEQQGNRVQIAQFLGLLGRIALYRGDLALAERQLERACAIARQIAPGQTLGGTGFLGDVAYTQGNYERAADLYAKFLDHALRDGNPLLTGWALTNLGMVAGARGDLDAAIADYRRALQSYRAIGYLEGLSEVFQRLAKVAAARREFVPAARVIGAAAALPYTVGSLGPPFEHVTYDRCVEEVRAALGEAAFAALSTAGAALSLDDAIAYALTLSANL